MCENLNAKNIQQQIMVETQQFKSIYDNDEIDDYNEFVKTAVHIIWGCMAGGLLIAFSVLVYVCIRKKRNRNRHRRQLTGENL